MVSALLKDIRKDRWIKFANNNGWTLIKIATDFLVSEHACWVNSRPGEVSSTIAGDQLDSVLFTIGCDLFLSGRGWLYYGISITLY